ncbi:MAG: PKD domain-containing protein, partial [Bacteroidota bacterium]
FGDGSPLSDLEEPSHTFSPGTYTVQLIAFHPESCNLSDTTLVEIIVSEDQDIIPDFDLFQSDCENLIVQAQDQSIGENLEYEWNMGDGTILNGTEVEHTYDVIGEYEVTLTITDPFCDIEETLPQTVNVQNEVTASIGNPDLEGCDPFDIEFMNQSSGNIFTWDFGDGSPVQNGQWINHVYTEPGTYTVTLTAEGTGGCEGIDVTTAEVIVNETPVIESIFDAAQIGDCESLEINTENMSVGNDLTYTWLVNGEQFFDEDINYTFSEPGSYTVQLSILEPTCDAQDTSEETFEVIEAVDFSMPDFLPICYYDAGATLQSNVPDGATVVWSTDEVTEDIYVTQPGEYLIEVTYNNCTDIDGIEVAQVPELDIAKTIATCEGTSTRLEVPYDGGTNVIWCEGNQSVEYIYVDEPGDYCYTFTDEFGCTQESNIEIVHIDLDADVYIPNAFTPNNDGINDVFGPKGEEIREFDLTVWNRWGDLVFESEQLSGVWDGSYQQGEYYAPDGIYTFQVEYKSTCTAEKKTVKGFVTLLR